MTAGIDSTNLCRMSSDRTLMDLMGIFCLVFDFVLCRSRNSDDRPTLESMHYAVTCAAATVELAGSCPLFASWGVFVAENVRASPPARFFSTAKRETVTHVSDSRLLPINSQGNLVKMMMGPVKQ